MPRKVIFVDGSDEFFINESGQLEHDDGVQIEVLVHHDGISDFIAWLTEEHVSRQVLLDEKASEI